jgi:hypothetical protein
MGTFPPGSFSTTPGPDWSQMPSRLVFSDGTVTPVGAPEGKFSMNGDRVIGDGGNVTVYERPDKSRYSLDKKGNGSECQGETPIFGRARFDARDLATGRWDGSRSTT